jgi:Glycosyltransferase family 87
VYLVLGPLCALLIAWLWTIFLVVSTYNRGPNGAGMGNDFAIYYAAAHVLDGGGNPYDHRLLYRAERDVMRHQGLPTTQESGIVLAGNPPLFFWALRPLASLPFQQAATVWLLSMYGLSALGFLALLRYFHWTGWLVPLCLFMAMPQVVLDAYDGNVIALALAAAGCAMALIRRHPLAAGAAWSLVLIKPQITLPLTLLVTLFHAPQRTRFLSGVAGCLAFLFVLTILTTGFGSLIAWFKAGLSFSDATAVEPKLAGLVGLYAEWAPTNLRLGFETLGVMIASLATFGIWLRTRGAETADWTHVGWLWFVWLLATPFAHFYDEIILAIPVLGVMGANGWRVIQPVPTMLLYLLFASVFLLRWVPHSTQLLWLPLLVVCVLLFRSMLKPAPRA